MKYLKIGWMTSGIINAQYEKSSMAMTIIMAMVETTTMKLENPTYLNSNLFSRTASGTMVTEWVTNCMEITMVGQNRSGLP